MTLDGMCPSIPINTHSKWGGGWFACDSPWRPVQLTVGNSESGYISNPNGGKTIATLFGLPELRFAAADFYRQPRENPDRALAPPVTSIANARARDSRSMGIDRRRHEASSAILANPNPGGPIRRRYLYHRIEGLCSQRTDYRGGGVFHHVELAPHKRRCRNCSALEPASAARLLPALHPHSTDPPPVRGPARPPAILQPVQPFASRLPSLRANGATRTPSPSTWSSPHRHYQSRCPLAGRGLGPRQRDP